jgi:hypothetical protein
MSLNLADFSKVSMSVSRKRKVYDLRYLGEGKGFQFGDVAKSNILPYSFNIGQANGAVYMQCVEDGEGQVFNTKYTGEGDDKKPRGKTGIFNRPNLRQLLDENGEDGVNYFRLELTEVEGYDLPIYKFVGITEEEATVEVTEDEDSSDSSTDEDEDFDMDEDETDEEGEDVFAKL